MKQYKSTDITRRSGEILEDALSNPVSITKYNRDKYVIMSAKHYKAMKASANTQEVMTTARITPEIKSEMLNGIEQELNRE